MRLYMRDNLILAVKTALGFAKVPQQIGVSIGVK